MTAPKIATCCYCGTRAALTLRGRERHELACSSCGAPLHDLKMLRTDHGGQRDLVKPSPIRHRPAPRSRHGHPPPVKQPPYRKRRKSFKRRLLEEAWDFIEDILD